MVTNTAIKPAKQSSYDIVEGVLSVKVRFAYKRGSRWHLQLPVPKDLQNHYKGSLIKRSLGTGSVFDAARAVTFFHNAYTLEFSQLRAGQLESPRLPDKTSEEVLKLISLSKPAGGLEEFISTLSNTDDSELTVATLVPTSVKPSSSEEYRLSDLTGVYLSHHRGASAKLIRDTTYTFNALIQEIGNKRITEVSRADIHTYRDKLIELGNKTATIRKRMGYLSAVFSVSLRELELDRSNPALAIRIKGEGEDKSFRSPVKVHEIRKLKPLIKSNPDDLRLILGMLIDTGCRLAEVVGLRLVDIKIDHEIPHVVIESNSARRLKTPSSNREIPLVGVSLWAAKKVVERNAGHEFAFPSYCSTTEVRANSASAALIKWIASKGVDKTPHEFRHGWADRLREVGCSPEIRKALGGWSIGGVAAEYGEGYSLKVKLEQLQKIANH